MSAGEERPGDEANDVVMFSHFLGVILDHLDKDPAVPELQVVELEWRYFSLLRHGTRPPRNLSKALATYPEFFVQLICLLYGPSPESGVRSPSPKTVRSPKGSRAKPSTCSTNGSGCPARRERRDRPRRSDAWLKRPAGSAEKRGVKKPAIAKSAISSPPRQGRGPRLGRPSRSGTPSSSAEAGRSSADLRWASVNRHGVTVRAPLAGGDQEREWAAYFRDQARRFEISWDRTAGLLDRVAEKYEDDARHQDDTRHTNPPIFSLHYPGTLRAEFRACEVGTIAP